MALITPILLLVLGGIIQFGTMFWSQNTLTQIARDTGRWAATQPTCGSAGDVAAIKDQADRIAGESSLLAYPGYAHGFADGVNVSWSDTDNCPPEDNTTTVWVTVGVRHRVPSFIPFLNVLLPFCDSSGCQLSTSAEFRMEPVP